LPRLLQVKEECRGVAVSRVDLVPDRRRPGFFQVTRRKRCLPGPEWTDDPNHRVFALLVEQRELPLARDGFMKSWSCQLGKLRSLL